MDSYMPCKTMAHSTKFMHGDPEDFFYPSLNEYLPNYSAYHSVLCVMSKYLSKIQQLGLDSGKSQDIPLWNA
jgi:hypothetical protein